MVDFSQKRVLIVDDFAQMRATLRHMLASFHVGDIDMAGSGRAALEQMAAKPYDIVLCDYNLGEGPDGQQVLEEAKHRNLLRYSAVFVMITAEATPNAVMGVIEHKPDDYLMKPFNKDVLRSRLEKLLARKSDFEAIEREIERGELSRAIELCEASASRAPKNLNEFLKLKAQLCLDVGRYDEAEKVYRQVLAKRAVPWAGLGLGRVRFHRKEYVEAVRLFRDVIARNKAYVEAYDWLARALGEMGQPEKAQEILEVAAALSPNAILRQKALGTIAFNNGDYATAERALRQAVQLGQFSVYRSASHYVDLAHAQVHNDAGAEAMKTLGTLRDVFRRDQDAGFQAAVMESVVLKKMDREAEAGEALEKAVAFYEKAGGKVSAEGSLGLGRALFVFGDEEKGREVLERVVRNNHESEKLLRDARDVFEQVGKGQEGRQLIERVAEEVVQLNNRGVGYVRAGKLEQAIRLFEEAAETMAGNQTLALNAAQAILMYMQKNVVSEEYLVKVHGYLQQAEAINSGNAILKKLWAVYRALADRRSQVRAE